MPNYVRKNGDLKYRKVSIQSTAIPSYIDFTCVGESVSYSDVQVLEVLREDGTTQLFHDGGIEMASYRHKGMDVFVLSSGIPRARLWMRRNDGTGIHYKVPTDLPVNGANVEFRVPGGIRNMELFGDKYLEMVYHLQQS